MLEGKTTQERGRERQEVALSGKNWGDKKERNEQWTLINDESKQRAVSNEKATEESGPINRPVEKGAWSETKSRGAKEKEKARGGGQVNPPRREHAVDFTKGPCKIMETGQAWVWRTWRSTMENTTPR